jgi:hypothetical protein
VLAARKSNNHPAQLVVCVCNDGYEVSLELRELYRATPDTRAACHHLLRVLDETGQDYLYPRDFFVPIELPKAIERVLFASA